MIGINLFRSLASWCLTMLLLWTMLWSDSISYQQSFMLPFADTDC